MSATLDTGISHVFKDPKLFDIEAPRFPVEIHYLANQPSILNQPLETKIKNTLASIKNEGDILVFVPGMREMSQVQERIGSEFGEVLLLHAELPKEDQDRALGKSSRRKIILSTNIAESSVTIPGIRIVIDSGIQREAQFSPWTGLKILSDKPVTQSSAIQRTGRAGREAAGECYRLFSKQDYDDREAFTIPEIMRADLLDTVLLSKKLSSTLQWPSPPPIERGIPGRHFFKNLRDGNSHSGGTFLIQHLFCFICAAALMFKAASQGLIFHPLMEYPAGFFSVEVLLLCFIIVYQTHGIFPFHSWVHDLVDEVRWYELAAIFLSRAGVLLYVQLMLPNYGTEPDVFKIMLLALSIISSIYWSYRGIFETNAQKQVTYFYIAQASLILTGLQANREEGLPR